MRTPSLQQARTHSLLVRFFMWMTRVTRGSSGTGSQRPPHSAAGFAPRLITEGWGVGWGWGGGGGAQVTLRPCISVGTFSCAGGTGSRHHYGWRALCSRGHLQTRVGLCSVSICIVVNAFVIELCEGGTLVDRLAKLRSKACQLSHRMSAEVSGCVASYGPPSSPSPPSSSSYCSSARRQRASRTRCRNRNIQARKGGIVLRALLNHRLTSPLALHMGTPAALDFPLLHR